MNEHIEMRLFETDHAVESRLAELGLSMEGLTKTVLVARTERNSVTDLHPANAPGTFAYHHGIASLRREFLGKDWVSDRSDGIETIFNETLGIKVSFCNVDQACGSEHPKPRSDKGPGAERASGGLFGDLPTFAPAGSLDSQALYYLMVDTSGRAELTRPVIGRGTFVGAVERILLIKAATELEPLLSLGLNDVANEFEPTIVRKQ